MGESWKFGKKPEKNEKKWNPEILNMVKRKNIQRKTWTSGICHLIIYNYKPFNIHTTSAYIALGVHT